MKHTLLGWNDARVHLVFYETASDIDSPADFAYALARLRSELGHKDNDPRWHYLDGFAPVGKTQARRRGLRCSKCSALMRQSRRLCDKCRKAEARAAAVKP